MLVIAAVSVIPDKEEDSPCGFLHLVQPVHCSIDSQQSVDFEIIDKFRADFRVTDFMQRLNCNFDSLFPCDFSFLWKGDPPLSSRHRKYPK